MDPNIQQWAQTPEAQPYLQQFMPQQQAQPMGMGTMGGGGFNDYLMQLIGQNQGNPKFQQQMLGYYLDTINPMNQPDPLQQQYQLLQNQMLMNQVGGYQSENLTNLALSLLTSENPELQGYGMNILKTTLEQDYSGYVQPETPISEKSPYDVIREGAGNRYSEMAGEGVTDLDTLNWQRYLSGADDEEIRRYNAAKKYKQAGFWGGGGILPWSETSQEFQPSIGDTLSAIFSLKSSDKWARERTGYGL
jgi:hypothetical protein